MKTIKICSYSVAVLFLAASISSCKSKKLVQKPEPVAVAKVETPVVQQPKAEPVAEKKEEPAPVAKPNYNFSNIQFEFNSGVLKTEAYPILDKAVMEIKKDPSAKFVLNGNSSAEGSDAHNLSLSVERAAAVKAYLINSGVSGDNLTVKGFGESKPIANNKSETGRALNRRVEIKKA
jgi:OOP family OmpA-OmpF porin